MNALEFRKVMAHLELNDTQMGAALGRKADMVKYYRTGKHEIPRVVELALQELQNRFKNKESIYE